MAVLFTRPPLQPGYQETLIFSTEISRSTSGSEGGGRRVSSFNTPEPVHRISMTPFGFSLAESAQLTNDLLTAMRNADGGVWVPLWGSEVELVVAADPTDTTLFIPTADGEFVPGGWLIISDPADRSRADLLQIDEIIDSSEILLQDEVTQAFGVGASVCPAVFCSLHSPAQTGFDSLARSVSGSVEFEEIGAPDWEGTYTFSGTTYLSKPVYIPDPDTFASMSGGPACSKVVRGDVWNNRTGAEYSPARQDLTWGWNRILRNRSQRMSLVRWFKYCKGALRNFWLRFPAPSFYTSLSASSGASTVTILNNGSYNALVGVRRHVWIGAAGHDRGYRISNPVLSVDGLTVQLTVTPTLAAGLPANSGLDILIYGRYTGDELDLQASNLGPDITEAQETFVEVQRDTPE